jgi:hypothetical protein
MSEERKKILGMVASGTISIDEAERLLSALGEEKTERTATASGAAPKYLRVQVESGKEGGEKVNIRIPLGILKAGIKIASFMPGKVQDKVNSALKEKGLDVDVKNLDSDGIDQLIAGLRDFTVDVDGGKNERVKIFCE